MVTLQRDAEVGSHTLTWMRRIDEKLDRVIEILLRHETRLGRVERDVNEVKSDQILLENCLLNQMNEVLTITRRIDELTQKIDERLPPLDMNHNPAR